MTRILFDIGSDVRWKEAQLESLLNGGSFGGLPTALSVSNESSGATIRMEQLVPDVLVVSPLK